MTIAGCIGDLRRSSTAWWLDQLELALPDDGRQAVIDRRAMRLVVGTEDEAATFTMLNPAGGVLFLEQVDWPSYGRGSFERCLARAVALARPQTVAVSLVLTHSIVSSLMIPRKARSQAEDIVRAHIRRKTPLRLDDIFLGCTLRPTRDRRLEVRYLATPRSLVDKSLQRLAITSSEIATVESRGDADAPPVIVPLASTRRTTARWGGRIAVGLVAVIVASVSLGFGSLTIRQELVLRQVERDVADLKASPLHSAHDPRATYAMADDLARFAELRGVPGVLRIWDDLAAILPLPTYLTEVAISGHSVRISGFSASASTVIQAIEGSAHVQDAVLTAPVVRGPDTLKERFSIKASLRQPRITSEELD